MPVFIVNNNPQINGEHEVHNLTTGCLYLPRLESQIPLGEYASGLEAVRVASVRWPLRRINGCSHCAPEGHTA